MKATLALVPFVLLAGVGCVPQNVTVAAPDPLRSQGLVVSGTATVRATPTLTVIRLGYDTNHPSPVTARATTDRAIKAIRQAVVEAGLKDADILTSDYSLRAYKEQNEPRSWFSSSSLELRVTEPERAAEVLSAALKAGANRVDTVDYTIENLADLRAKARDEACRIAKEKAEQYAKNFKVKLGKPIAISEGNNPYFNYRTSNVVTQSVSYVPGEGATDPDALLSSGSVAVTLKVEVTYRI